MTFNELLHKPIPPIPRSFFNALGWVCLYCGWGFWVASLPLNAFSFMDSMVVMGELVFLGLVFMTTAHGFIILFPYVFGLIASLVFVFARHKRMGRVMRFFSLGIIECLFLFFQFMNSTGSMDSFIDACYEFPGIPVFLLANMMILVGVWLMPVYKPEDVVHQAFPIEPITPNKTVQ